MSGSAGETPAQVEAEEEGGLSGGAVAGIVIGSVFGSLTIAGAVLYILNKKSIVKIPFVDKAIEKVTLIFKKK